MFICKYRTAGRMLSNVKTLTTTQGLKDVLSHMVNIIKQKENLSVLLRSGRET